MRTVALISGGKDSCYNILQCIAAGHEVVALANLHPPRNQQVNNTSEFSQLDEMDSYMFQTVGHDAITLLAEALDLPLYRGAILGSSIQQGSDYTYDSQDDEVEDLFRLLQLVKNSQNVEAVSVGAILSNYQRVRVENVCNRLGLTSLSYLWQRDQKELLEEMINCGMNAILIKVAALGLDPVKHLGKSIKDCQEELIELEKKFGLNVCGEGGEYETLTLDCPVFKKRIIVEEAEMVLHSKDPFAPVGYLRFPSIGLVNKDFDSSVSYEKIKSPEDYCAKELKTTYFQHEITLDEADPKSGVEIDFRSLGEDFLPTDSSPDQKTEDLFYIGGLHSESESEFLSSMEQFRGLVENFDASMNSVLSVCLYIKDMKDYPKINAVYQTFFGLNPPVRVCVQAPLTCYAIIEALVTKSIDAKQTLHVQSISHWAPANIGPYSQCVKVRNFFMVSGQIGLIPGSMTLPHPQSFTGECRLALRSANRVLCAMDSSVSLKNAIQVTCFLRDEAHINLARSLWIEYDGDSGHPIAFIVTSGLPRNALVEWQIWAHRESGSTIEVKCSLSPSQKDCVFHVTRTTDAITLMCKIYDLPTDVTGWQKLFQVTDHHLKAAIFYKVYYRNSCSQLELKTLRDGIPTSVPSVLLPVCGLEPGVACLVCAVKC